MGTPTDHTNAGSRRCGAGRRTGTGGRTGRFTAALGLLVVCATVLFAGFGIGVTACSSAGSKVTTGARAKSNGGSVVFDELPQYHDATAVGSPNVHGTTTTQTFTVRDATPSEILSFYADQLDGWTVTSKPHRLAQGPQAAWRGSWMRGGQRLLVSSAPAPGLGRGRTQYSLDLRS